MSIFYMLVNIITIIRQFQITNKIASTPLPSPNGPKNKSSEAIYISCGFSHNPWASLFFPYQIFYGQITDLVRVLAIHSKGSGFESRYALSTRSEVTVVDVLLRILLDICILLVHLVKVKWGALHQKATSMGGYGD